jgi:hypothetical protein
VAPRGWDRPKAARRAPQGSWRPWRADLATNEACVPAAIQINMPREPGTFDGTSQVGRDPEGRVWLLRQGRLQPNGSGSVGVKDFDFSRLTGIPYAFETPKIAESPARWWFRVCRRDAEPALIRAQNVEFVRRSQRAREQVASGSFDRTPVGDADRARTLQGKLEPTGSFVVPPQDQRVVERLHAQVINALIEELEKNGIANRKVWHIDGYEADLTIGDGDAALLIEAKTGARAADVHAGVGQLIIYRRLMPELRHHRPILLMPSPPTLALRDAVMECGIEWHSYEWSEGVAGRGMVLFDTEFRMRCGLPCGG